MLVLTAGHVAVCRCATQVDAITSSIVGGDAITSPIVEGDAIVDPDTEKGDGGWFAGSATFIIACVAGGLGLILTVALGAWGWRKYKRRSTASERNGQQHTDTSDHSHTPDRHSPRGGSTSSLPAPDSACPPSIRAPPSMRPLPHDAEQPDRPPSGPPLLPPGRSPLSMPPPPAVKGRPPSSLPPSLLALRPPNSSSPPDLFPAFPALSYGAHLMEESELQRSSTAAIGPRQSPYFQPMASEPAQQDQAQSWEWNAFKADSFSDEVGSDRGFADAFGQDAVGEFGFGQSAVGSTDDANMAAVSFGDMSAVGFGDAEFTLASSSGFDGAFGHGSIGFASGGIHEARAPGGHVVSNGHGSLVGFGSGDMKAPGQQVRPYGFKTLQGQQQMGSFERKDIRSEMKRVEPENVQNNPFDIGGGAVSQESDSDWAAGSQATGPGSQIGGVGGIVSSQAEVAATEELPFNPFDEDCSESDSD